MKITFWFFANPVELLHPCQKCVREGWRGKSRGRGWHHQLPPPLCVIHSANQLSMSFSITNQKLRCVQPITTVLTLPAIGGFKSTVIKLLMELLCHWPSLAGFSITQFAKFKTCLLLFFSLHLSWTLDGETQTERFISMLNFASLINNDTLFWNVSKDPGNDQF